MEFLHPAMWHVALEVVHGLFKEPIIGSLKSKMVEIRHVKNQHDAIFTARCYA